MKKLLLIFLFFVSLNAQELIIKRDNGIVSLSFEKKDGFYLLSNGKKFKDNVKIIIVYTNNKYKKALEEKYNLTNARNMYNMYIIYEQNSRNIIDLFSKLTKEKNIKRVYPNWITSIKKF